MANNVQNNQVAKVVHVVPALTEAQLVTKLLNLRKGANFVTVVTRTVPGMNQSIVVNGAKVPNPYFDAISSDFKVRKVSEVNGQIGYDYENAVNNQRIREDGTPDFVAQPRKWGIRVDNSCVFEHKGQFYFDMRVLKSIGHYYVDLKGNTIETSEVEKCLKPRSPNKNQETDKEIIVRDYTIANVLSISINGEKFVIIH